MDRPPTALGPGVVSMVEGDRRRRLLEDSPDLNTVVDVDGVFCYVSPACRRLFGWDPADLVGHPEDEFVHADDLASLHTGRAELAEAEVATMSFRFLCRDGSSRWTETTSRRVEVDGSSWTVSAVRDTTNIRAHIVGLEIEASSDPLTGVANRRVLMDRLRQGLRRMSRGDGVIAVLYLDMDRFKIVNDSLGHGVGDAVLLEMASRLVNHVRPADTVARLGGDEFVIVAETLANEEAAVELAERIIQAGREPFRMGIEDFACTVSVGIACSADSQRDADELLSQADMALYRAKERGRDRAEAFDEELQTRANGRLATERLLRRALHDKRVVVEYQPIIDLRNGRPVAAEALVRISDPDGGLVLPQSFLEVAEETGLLVRMDQQVLADAIKQVSVWQFLPAANNFAGVSVNVTARHLAAASFHRTVIKQLDANEVDHGHLAIELTERTLLEASNSAMKGLHELRDAGVRVGLDGFGTGYSSLVHLCKFPLDFVKIDRSFIQGIEAGTHEQAFVGAIVSLAHALGLSVVAAGVENHRQLRVLQELGCDLAQGFLFARSGGPEGVANLVKTPPNLTVAPLPDNGADLFIG